MKALLRNTIFSTSLSTVGLMLVPTLSTQAAVPTDSSLLRLAKVTKVVDQANDISNSSGVAEQVTQSILSSISSDNISKEKRQRFNEIVSKYSKEMTNSSQIGDMNQQIINVYMQTAKQHFDQREVDAQIAFYSSEIGQSIIDKQPAMLNDYMEKVMPIAMESTMKKVKNTVPKMVAEIKALQLEK